MQIIRWMCGISLKDRRTHEELRRLVGVEPITTFIRGGRLRWYGHMMRIGDEDWVKKCMGYIVEGRRPVGRPRKTWLESVEVDMTELEIDKEGVHDRRKRRRNVMKRNSNPIGKRTTNRYYIIYIYSQHPCGCVNNIVLTLILKQSKFDVLICSLNVFHSHGAA